MKPRSGVFGLVSALAVAAAPMAGQTTNTDSIVATAVRSEWLVRLRVDHARAIGRLSNQAGGSVQLNAESGRRTIAIAGIDTLWARGRAFKTGGIVGGVVGVVGGSLFGAFLAAICDAAVCRSQASGALVGGLAGLPAGMLVGAGVGALFPHWNRKLP